jgi:hypothetical protein
MTTQADELMKLADDYAVEVGDYVDDRQVGITPEKAAKYGSTGRAALRSAIEEALGQARQEGVAACVTACDAQLAVYDVKMAEALAKGWGTKADRTENYREAVENIKATLAPFAAPPADALQQMEGER